MDRPLYIFDIDGTIALIDHRIYKLDEKHNPNRWREFYALCGKDKPNIPIIKIMSALRVMGADIWFFSGRSSEVRNKTVEWIAEHTAFMSFDVDSPILTMREEGDYTPDNELKQSWFDNMLWEDKERLVAVFDDRNQVVDMWRRNGVTCLQVAFGEF